MFQKGRHSELIIPHLVEGSMPVLQEEQFFFFFLKTCFCIYGCPFNKVIDSVIVIYSKLRRFFSRFKKNELSVEYVQGSVLELIIQR